MTEVHFMEVREKRLEERACEISERLYARGERVQVAAANKEQARRLDNLLWTFRPDSFVPHRILEGRDDDPDVPVVITIGDAQILGNRHLLMLDYHRLEAVSQFAHAIHFVVIDNEERLAASRQYWVQLRDAGFALRHRKR